MLRSSIDGYHLCFLKKKTIFYEQKRSNRRKRGGGVQQGCCVRDVAEINTLKEKEEEKTLSGGLDEECRHGARRGAKRCNSRACLEGKDGCE